MKKLFLIIIGLCLCTALYADMNTYIIGSGAVSAGGCETALWTSSSSGTTDTDINDTSSGYQNFVGQIIEDTSARTICKVITWISYKGGDISGKTFRAYFAPIGESNALTTGSAVEADATVTGSNEWDSYENNGGTQITWEFSSGYSMTANTTYAFYITMDGGYDSANYAELELSTGDNIPGGGSAAWSPDGTNRAADGVDIKAVFCTE